MAQAGVSQGGIGALKQPLLAVGSLAFAGLLLAILIWAGDVETGLLLSAIAEIRPAPLALIGLTTVMILGLSAYKWKLVTETLRPEATPSPGLSFYFFYTCLGGVFGLVLPPHVSSVVVRSIGLKLHHRMPVGHGASTSVIEQMFDLLIPVACAGPGLLYVFDLIAFRDFALLSLACAAGLALAAVVAGPRALGWLASPLGRPLDKARRLAALRQALRHYAGAVGRRLLAQLCLLSVFRFAVMGGRAVLIASAMGLLIEPAHLWVGLPFVQLSFLVALTPASIGIAEWTWSGVLYGLGTGLAVASQFALLHRIFSAGVVVALTALLWTLRLLRGITAKPAPGTAGPS